MEELPLILIFGPTAVGKTEMILRVFPDWGEIISADSMQVYRGLDIGTAKPSPEICSQVPHHLIDILNPDQQYTAGEFVHRTEELIPAIRQRGRIPVICGGTAYYFRNFLFGLPETPPGDPQIRKQLQERLLEEGTSRLYTELERIDPITAERISARDTYRILRSLEVYYCTGRPLSSFSVPLRPRSDFPCRIIGLMRDREELYQRINDRVDEMFHQGLPEEVSHLIAQGFGETAPGMRGIGYREFFIQRYNGCIRIKDVRNMIQQDSRRYAKRQITFFKTIPGVRWVHPDTIKSLEDLLS
ncbi:MAG TPA: tRNA (adenosine(37)-N6)-dimethylallyltransferase MiaA [Spirochaetales bacterium]|nr:tRNA (adenosine(37)-N6)-dimethylallyltransferase MiaA [Spirochaetales bacterium]